MEESQVSLMLRRTAFIFALVLSVYSLSGAQSSPITVNPGRSLDTATIQPAAAPPEPAGTVHLKPSDLDSRQPLTDGTKMQLIRVLDAEFAHVRKYFPIGDKSMIIAPDGLIKPGDDVLFRMAQSFGAAAKVGDRVQITNIVFREKSVYLEINGGPKKKSKWYQHIQISGMGGSTGGTDPNQAQPTGAGMTVEFKKRVPEMTGAELKQILAPVLDFSVKTASEVFIDTLPPKIKQAVKNHEVLVGMNHDMVVMAKDRPPQKVRERDDKGQVYEEWIYGAPPQDVVFVRFVGDEVVQVKTAKVGGQLIVKTEKEVEVKDGVPTLSAMKASDRPQDVQAPTSGEQQPAHRPTLKRPDEQPDTSAPGASRGAGAPLPASPEEPQWGSNGKQPADTGSPQQEPPKQPPR
jgi:hypothetical protein